MIDCHWMTVCFRSFSICITRIIMQRPHIPTQPFPRSPVCRIYIVLPLNVNYSQRRLQSAVIVFDSQLIKRLKTTNERKILKVHLLAHRPICVCTESYQCACPSVSAHVRLSVRMSVCQCACPSVRLSVRMSLCPSVTAHDHLSVRMSVCLCACPSVGAHARLSVRMSVCTGNRENVIKSTSALAIGIKCLSPNVETVLRSKATIGYVVVNCPIIAESKQ